MNDVKVKIDTIELPVDYTTMSSKIRFLLGLGYSRSEVSKRLGIRYQWVRNVEITPVKKK